MREITLLILIALASACAATPSEEAADDTDEYGCPVWKNVLIEDGRVSCVDPEDFEALERDLGW